MNVYPDFLLEPRPSTAGETIRPQPTMNSTQFLSRRTEDDMPQGECRFISNRQRCECVSFTASNTIPGACGCGHQQWIHLRQPSSKSVPISEYVALVNKLNALDDKCKKLQYEQDSYRLEKERYIDQLASVLTNQDALVKEYCDRKIQQVGERFQTQLEDILDQVEDTLERGISKQNFLEAFVMKQLDELDIKGGRNPRSVSPSPDGTTNTQNKTLRELTETPLTIRVHHRSSPQVRRSSLQAHQTPLQALQQPIQESWSVSIVFIPNRNASHAPDADSVAYRRCQTRGLHQSVTIKDRTSDAFVKAVEEKFSVILRKRLWMPLQCLNSDDFSLGTLDLVYQKPSIWQYCFLEVQCIGKIKAYGGNIIFIALKDEVLSWVDIKALPGIWGSDDSVWDYNEELDGDPKDLMEFTRTTVSNRDTTYSVDPYNTQPAPPPYTSSATPRQIPTDKIPPSLPSSPAAIDSTPHHHLSADTSSQHIYPTHYGYSRSIRSAPSISERSLASSLDSDHITEFPGLERHESASTHSVGEHRDKRTRRHGATGSSSSASSSSGNLALPGILINGNNMVGSKSITSPKPRAGTVVNSGRVKRRITEKSKYREPWDWRVSEFSLKGLRLNRRPSTSSGDHAPNSLSTSGPSSAGLPERSSSPPGVDETVIKRENAHVAPFPTAFHGNTKGTIQSFQVSGPGPQPQLP